MSLKKIFILLFSNISLMLYAQDTVTVYYDKDWKEIQEKEHASYYRKAFVENNIWKVNDYYMSYKLQMTGTYPSKKFDIRQGHFDYYYENGQKESEGDFINDKHSGMWLYFYENGVKKSEGTYMKGNSQGLWKYWYDTKEPKSEGNYVENKKDGLWRYLYKNGAVKTEETMVRGKIIYIKGYFEDGKLQYKGAYSNNERTGEWVYWNNSGKLFMQGSYQNGQLNGEWVRFYPNGEKGVLIYKNGTLVNLTVGGIITKDLDEVD